MRWTKRKREILEFVVAHYLATLEAASVELIALGFGLAERQVRRSIENEHGYVIEGLEETWFGSGHYRPTRAELVRRLKEATR